MPFCPKCKSEFQNWVTACPDCHQALVDTQPPPPEGTLSDIYPVIWVRAINRFCHTFNVRLDKRGLISVMVVILAVIVTSGSVFYFLGEKDGVVSGQAEARTLLQGLRSESLFQDFSINWFEWYQKQNAQAGIAGKTMQVKINRHYETNDLARAQEQVPFSIVLPVEMPMVQDKQPAPIFRGTIERSEDSKVDVHIYLATGATGIMAITESNYPTSQSYSEFDSGSKWTEIGGAQVLKGKDGALAFQLGNVYFIVQAYDVADEEVAKFAESLIRQH